MIFYSITEAANWLLDFGADINFIEPEFRSTPLGWASRWGKAEMAATLLERGVDVKHAGMDWSTPMAWALRKGHTTIVELLK